MGGIATGSLGGPHTRRETRGTGGGRGLRPAVVDLGAAAPTPGGREAEVAALPVPAGAPALHAARVRGEHPPGGRVAERKAPRVGFGFPVNPRWPSQPLAPIFNLFNEISFPVIPETGNL